MDTYDDYFVATGGDPSGYGFSNTAGYAYGVYTVGWRAGVYGQLGQADGPDTNNFTVLAGIVGTSQDGVGVRGTSANNAGVYGQNGLFSGPAPQPIPGGVCGMSEYEPGVVGWSRESDGVQGLSFTGAGVHCFSLHGSGLISLSGALAGVTGISDTQGPPVPNIGNIAGVVGSSDQRTGVIGTSNAFVGVYGFSNNIGVVGQSTNPASYAGYFSGNVIVTGTLTATVKNAVVAFPDGSQRVLHCMESPEHWFEDFGAAKLKRGRAVVKLDADFAKVVKLNDYHVFFTPEGDCGGLYVRRQSAKSFEVRELMRGKSSVAFSYRIVARRKDIKAHRRFAKIDMRLPLPAAAARPRRKAAPTSSALRAFVARLEKEARQRRAKGSKQTTRSRALPKHRPPRVALPPRSRRSEKG
jgi:hypothetical protein